MAPSRLLTFSQNVPTTSPEKPTRRKAHFFWWTLINALCLVFAVLSWFGCYYLFQFPEKPFNYQLIQKLGGLEDISFFKGEELPKGTSLGPQKLYRLIYDRKPLTENEAYSRELLDAPILKKLNEQLRRNYITNYKKSKENRYINGTWRILSHRPLGKDDFITDGYAILTQALAIPIDQLDSTNPILLPYPVELEIIVPSSSTDLILPSLESLPEDHALSLSRARQALTIIHITRSGTLDEPASRITVVPLLGEEPFKITKDLKIPLTVPEKINPKGTFPLFSTQAEEIKES